MERTAPGACAGRRLRFAKRRAFADGDAGAIGVDDGADHHYIEYFGRLTTLLGTMRERSYSCFLSRLCN